jgi:hypothetical protein
MESPRYQLLWRLYEEAEDQDLERPNEEADECQHQMELRNERAEQVYGKVEHAEHAPIVANDPSRATDWRDFAGEDDGEEVQ